MTNAGCFGLNPKMRGLCVTVVLFAGVGAQAQKHPKPAEKAPVPAPESPSESQARQFLDDGKALLEQGNARGALEKFEQARDLHPDRANPYRWIGTAQARLDDCEHAIANFAIFLNRVEDTDSRRPDVITARAVCQKRLADKKAADEAVRKTPPAVAPPPRWMKPTGIALLSVGAVAGGLAVAAFVLDGQPACQRMPGQERCPQLFTTLPWAIGLAASGGAALIAGAIFTALTHAGTRNPPQLTLAPNIDRNMAGLIATGSF